MKRYSKDMWMRPILDLESAPTRAGAISKDQQHYIALLDEVRGHELRRKICPSSWQSKVAWAILTEIYRCELSNDRPSIKQVQIGAECPPATMLRHLTVLQNEGWVDRTPSKSDSRVVYLSLSKSAVKLMDSWAQARFKQLLKLRTMAAA
ncbi:MAG: hypothetical protein SXU28_00125 [Pseudomonadota bacterium]|nr:hypothetical protein [Pseudomonadota bacterium]